jgi:hypothetical protein
MNFSQGQTITVKTPIFFKGESKRLRQFKTGDRLWVVSNFVLHNQGVVKLAKMGQNSACGTSFLISDVEKSINIE